MFKVLAHGEIVYLRVVFFLVVGHIMARGDIRLDHVDLIKRRQDQQLQVKLLEEFHCIACVHLIRPDERLVDHDKAESLFSLLLLVKAVLVGDGRGEDGIGELRLLPTGLASAIAYQYGLDQQEERKQAFRFVVIDEAFVRSDEMTARYAMELFKQLDLQLLVVTPLDKIHVIEPYITACHYVTNNQEENDSKVYNFTMSEYFEHKQALQAGVGIGDYTG